MNYLLTLVHNYGLYGLFLSVFFSYSIIPSFTVAPMLVAVEFFSAWTVFIVSIIAATLGSITNYYIGLKGIRRFFPNDKHMSKAEEKINRFGPYALIFLTWLPIVGDPIIIAAGVLKMDFWKFLLYSTLSKIWYLALIIFFGITIFG